LFQEAKKKPMNVSLYIMGEYDILNDLVYDGARRLRDNADSTDLDLLRQNGPCPPPDRWVRPTGWGRCNPSSLYARDPPPDFDWVRYYDKLRVKTGPYARGGVGRRGGGGGRGDDPARSKEVGGGGGGGSASDGNGGAPVVAAEPQDRLSKATGDTQATESTAPIANSSSDLSCDEHHRVNGRLIMVTRAGSDGRAAATLPTDPSPASSANGGGEKGAASSHFNNPRARAESDAAPSGRAQGSEFGASSHFNNPRARASSDAAPSGTTSSAPTAPTGAAAGSKSKGFVRKISSVFGGRKKSSGAE
jgi:hypothetical protein